PQASSSNPKPNALLPTPQTQIPVYQLPPVEIRDRRTKGLCFKCDEKWNPSHRCRGKVLLLLGADDDDIDNTIDDSTPEDVTGDISSLHALSSQLQGRSLRVSSAYGHHHFQTIIDSGITHNFISPSLVERLGLPMTPCPQFRVATGCGSSLRCQYCCPAVPLNLQGITFSVDLFILAIEGPDVVLGFPWLQLLGKVTHDYSALTMEFTWEGHPVTLRGDSTIHSQSVSLLQLQALVQSDRVAGIFAISTQPPTTPSDYTDQPKFPSHLPEPVLSILQRFHNIFVPSTGLPLHRSVDHCIHLVEGTPPINVRPYRYPHFQKSEMEKLIREMLEQGIICLATVLSHSRASLEDHLQHLELVLNCLLANTFYVKLSKCLFYQESIEYLGHIVSSQGVHVDPSKLEAMVKLPIPTTVKQLRGFLGLIGYYHRFIANYASIATPLTDLLRHDAFAWTDSAASAFTALKQAMIVAVSRTK
ncbi:hypothetical protein A2U01_0006152, partial [Trifolium medium]|nr:hypothetical protein [Trifolium medium]